jgi:hypothetical protein
LTVVAAIAFKEGESAAATIAATMIPAGPPASEWTMNVGRTSSLRDNGAGSGACW